MTEFVLPNYSFKCKNPILAETTLTSGGFFFYNPEESLCLVGVSAINPICCFSVRVNQRYDCVAQEIFPSPIIISFMCARREAAVHQCLSVSMLTCFLSVRQELRPSSSDQRWFCGCSAAFELAQQLFSDPCRPRFFFFGFFMMLNAGEH